MTARPAAPAIEPREWFRLSDKIKAYIEDHREME